MPDIYVLLCSGKGRLFEVMTAVIAKKKIPYENLFVVNFMKKFIIGML
jgi:hypothetical protein